MLASVNSELAMREPEGNALVRVRTTVEAAIKINVGGAPDILAVNGDLVASVAVVGVGDVEEGAHVMVNMNGGGLGAAVAVLEDVELSPWLDSV